MPLGLTQPPTKMITRNISLGAGGGGGQSWPMRKADNRTNFMC